MSNGIVNKAHSEVSITSFGSTDYFSNMERGFTDANSGTANGGNRMGKRWNENFIESAKSKSFSETWPEFHLRQPDESASRVDSRLQSHVMGDHRGVTPSSPGTLSTGTNSPGSGSGSSVVDATEQRPVENVVMLQNAKKSYRSKNKSAANATTPVIDGLNMNVRRGIIYGLLGASGCGKTTVLSCIVGRRTIDSGKIRVFGGVPGNRKTGVPGKRIGYMPQELALYPEFTIAETLSYFGRIHGLNRNDVKDQIEFLLTLLDLPEKNRIIRTLSGGQQRRVSFAVALLHNPELLILDEPTVGVDPMLRQSIWSHLVRLVRQNNKTVIITTHYIEEARQAHCVGLMRHGRLLAEDSPQNLLESYNMNSIEDVFLKLCINDNYNSDQDLSNSGHQNHVTGLGGLPQSLMSSLHLTNTMKRKQRGSLVYPGATAVPDDVTIKPISYSRKPAETELTEFQKIKRRLSMKTPGSNSSSRSGSRPPCCQFTVPSIMKIWALMFKNFTKLFRNTSQLLFIFLLPAIQVIFFCIAIGRDPYDLNVAVVNNENPDMYVNSTSNNCSYTPGCDFSDLSCRLFDYVFNSSVLNPVYYEDEESAMNAVQNGQAWASIIAPNNFSDMFLKRLSASIEIDAETINKSSIMVYLDNSNQQVSFSLQHAFVEGYMNFFRKLLDDCGFPEETGDLPIVFGNPIHGPKEANFTEFMAPGIIILIIFFLALALTAELFITERRDGLLDRSWIAGVLPSEMLIAHVTTQFIVLIAQTTITLIFIFLVFKIPCKGPIGWLIGLALLQGTAGMCYGLLLSALCSDLATSMQLAIGSFYPNLLLSGILWPVEAMPWYLRPVAWYLPCTAACQAMRDVMARGWDISKESVYLGYLSTSAWIAVFLILCWATIKLKAI